MRIRRTKAEIAAGVTIEQKRMAQTIETALEATPAPDGPLKKLTRKKQVHIPVHDDPKQELRRLVGLHKAWLKKSTSISNMYTDKKYDGVLVKSTVPLDIKAQMETVRNAFKTEATRLESAMKQELTKFPVYEIFLKHVRGCGVVTAAYLVAMVDIRKAEKPSQLRRYCGFAVIDGKLERRTSAPKCMGGNGTYNDSLRTALFLMFSSMIRTRGDCTTTYLDIYRNVKHREDSAQRKGGHSKGWHKACDVFLEDLYTVWRALEGLPVWPAYHSAKLGLRHEGRIHGIASVMLTVEEALAVVGSMEPRPFTWKPEVEEEIMEAAE